MLTDVIRTKMNQALKDNDGASRRVYSLILDALDKELKAKRNATALTEAEEGAVILKLIKMADETLKLTPADKTSIINDTEFEKTIYSIYAPAQMSKEAIALAIETVVYQLHIERPRAKDKGLIMKNLMPIVKGKADGQLVNKLVEERLAD